ncbi:MAG: AgmX/PglI C-terminal domain-containing protein [Sterolibacteriaceae bacterium]|nr:AgmX/PglI C-terminal domain-containing protein [Sterolibacteriaceae bacterium]
MVATAISFRTRVLPWDVSAADEERFRRIFCRVLTVSALICLVLLLLPRPEVDRAQPQDLPPRIAKLLLELPVASPPPPAKQEPVRPKDDKTEPTKPEAAKAKPVPEARRPQRNKPPGEIESARRKAAGVGLLAMKDQLAELRGAPLAVQLNQDIKPGAGVGAGVGPGVGAGTDPGVPARNMITSNATGGSGGIDTAGYSRNTGGGGLAGRATTLVKGVAGGGGGGGLGAGGGDTLHKGTTGKASRSIEEIKLVFDRNKGSIYAIYNRALRQDPTLQGKVVLKLKIAPSGEVVDCEMVSSELKSPDLERKLLARIKRFDFGAKDVDMMIVNWPVDFLPS